MIKVLIVGDIIGRTGRKSFERGLDEIRRLHDPEIVLVNGDNLAGGFGITKKVYKHMVDTLKVDAIAMGNHWHDKPEVHEILKEPNRLIIPANMDRVGIDAGLKLFKSRSGYSFALMHIVGKVFMHPSHKDPFESAENLYSRIPSDIKIRFFDVHAEATSEKQAMGFLYASKVSVVYGTHTHVPTADERIIENHTGFVTDLGLTGAYDSLIGMQKSKAISRLVTGIKKPRLEPAEKDPWFCGILVEIDPKDGRCASIERLQIRFNQIDL